MKTLLWATATVVLLTMSIPGASADAGTCEAGACAGTHHTAYGTCDGAADGNAASRTDGIHVTAIVAYAYVQDFCYQGTFFGSNYGTRGIEAWAGVYCGFFQCSVAGVQWEDYARPSGSTCTTNVYAVVAGLTSVGCPAGSPPMGYPLDILP
jgi:hypothetical protein